MNGATSSSKEAGIGVLPQNLNEALDALEADAVADRGDRQGPGARSSCA